MHRFYSANIAILLLAGWLITSLQGADLNYFSSAEVNEDNTVPKVSLISCDGVEFDSGAASCQSSSCQPGNLMNPWSGFYFGSSLVLAKPHLKESFQANILDPTTGAMTLVPFSTNYRTAPRAWLGFGSPSGLGAQARYWEYNQQFSPFTSTTTFTSLPGAQSVTIIYPAAILATTPGDVLSVTSGLEMRSLDVEGTQFYQLRSSQLLLSGGLRYAMIRQDYSATVQSGGVPISSLNWDRRLEGVGPIAGAQ